MMWTLTKIGYRIFQFVFYKACYLLIWRKPELISGPGSLSALPAAIQARGISNVLVVTDKGLMKTGIPDRLFLALDTAKIKYTLFDSVEANPSIDTVERAREIYVKNQCQGFVAIGGGSSMDTAKAAGTRIARPKKSLEKMGGFLKVGRKLPYLFMIPTTAGTGSETTIVAVVTNRQTQHKFAISDLHLIPHVAVLDPELTVGLPPAITAATGMDAMTHAVESYICQGVPGICKRQSEEAVALIVKNIEKVYTNGSDLKARENMLTASFYAGAAFTRAGLNYIHPIAHTISGLYDEPHGRANAVIMPYVLDFFGPCVHRKLARLATVAGLDVKGKSEAEAAEAFIAEIRRLNRAMKIPEGFDFIRSKDIPRICEWALHEANPFYPVPKILGQADMMILVKQIMQKSKDEDATMDLSAIVKNQRDFFNTDATKSVKFRRNALQKLYKAIAENERMIFDALKADLNKTDFEGYMTEVGIIREECRFAIKHLRGWAKAKRAATPLAQFASKSFVIPEPYGVALIMSPWNYPFQLTIAPLIGAIAAGNCAVIKPSAYSPATSQAISDLITGIFPKEYIAVILGGRAENSALLELKFDYIFFTGSTTVGHLVMEKAAKHLTPISLELGGKSPALIDETANIPLTATRLAWGKYLNAGQTCVAPDYVLVHESKKEELIKELRRAIKQFFPSAIKNEDYVRIINEKQFDRLLGLIEKEKAVIGGKYDRAKLRIVPTVLDNITFESKVMGEEIFGPVLPILTYTDLDEVIALLRDKPKPLAMYLFTSSKATEKKVLRSLSFGGGCVNDAIIHLATSHMGFGGVGNSGMGAYHGKLSFDTFTHKKSIVDKKTWIDLPMRYRPYSDLKYKLIRLFLK